MLCPTCQVRLIRVKTAHGMLYQCPKCGGRAAGMSLLRRVGSKKSIRLLWLHARKGGEVAGAACPVCRRAMVEVVLPPADSAGPLRLDVCPGCQFIWFDPHEFGQFPPPDADPSHPLPEKAREILAMRKVRRVAEEAKKADHADHFPDQPWHWIPAMLGLPFEKNAPPLSRWPWLTYGLAAALVAVYALTAGHLRPAIEEYGLVPADMWRHGGLTFITSFFLHGGVLHLIGNVYFLLIFGDNVEDDLGWWRYAALLAVAALVGDLSHILGDPQSTIPCIGASGGISGVITYYALRFPYARVGLLLRYYFYFRWVSIPAWGALILWFLLQLVFVYHQQQGIGNVAALAHLGGAAMGVAAWGLWQLGGAKT